MAKKQLKSGLELKGVGPNILLQHVEHTAPFLFQGELDTSGPLRAYLERLIFYKKNLKLLKNIDLAEYFYICMAAHWSTAGTFVPTNVDNQIREGLWKHEHTAGQIERMTKITLDSWLWDYSQVTNRKSYNQANAQVMSTHEGTWLSVAIGGYCALVKHQRPALAEAMAAAILAEVEKEERLLLQLHESRDHINFLRTTALMAHNFGDLDRVMDQWKMDPDSAFFKRIYKLGHQLNPSYSPILVYAGQVNKAFLAQENHRHMSMRQPKCLRRSHHFLIPIGPFMDDWGFTLGSSKLLSLEEKGEIVAAYLEGFSRQDQAFGYARALRGMLQALPDGLNSLAQHIAFDAFQTIKNSKLYAIANQDRAEFESNYRQQLEQFQCPITGWRF